MTGRVVSTGSVIVDLPLTVPALPERGGDILAAATPATPGGGFNIVIAAARQGATVGYLGRLGEGRNADLCRQALADAGIAHLGATTGESDTGFCVTLTEPDGERSFITVPGAESVVTPMDLPSGDELAGDIVFVSGYDLCYPGSSAALAAWVAALPQTVQVLFDPGPLVGEILPDLLQVVLRRCDICSVNEREAGLLWDVTAAEIDTVANFAAAWERIRADLGSKTIVLLRVGERGCLLADPHQSEAIIIPSISVRPVDSTGAGDAHAGVLMAQLIAGRSLQQAVREANVAAAMTVTHQGPATSPTADELATVLATS